MFIIQNGANNSIAATIINRQSMATILLSISLFILLGVFALRQAQGDGV